jgi:hypothetical protein
MPIFFQFVHGDSPINAAVRLLPIILTFVFFGLGGGAIVSKTGRYYPWFFAGGIFTIIGGSLLCTSPRFPLSNYHTLLTLLDADVSISSPVGKLYGYSALVGIGGGAAGQLSYSAAQFKVDPKYIPSTIGFICMGQYVGLTLALCIEGSIFNNYGQRYVAALLPAGTPIEVVRAVIQGVDTTILAAQTEETRLAILEAVVQAIRKTYPVTIAAGCLMFGATLMLK